MRVRYREERKKIIKILCAHATVTVHICTVTVLLQGRCVDLNIFTKIGIGVFWVKICKIEHFFVFCTFLQPPMWLLLDRYIMSQQTYTSSLSLLNICVFLSFFLFEKKIFA